MATASTRKSSASTAKKSKKFTLDFSEYDRETKNAIRFQEDLPKGKDRGDIGFVYILKTALERVGIDPEMGVRLTIEELPPEDES